MVDSLRGINAIKAPAVINGRHIFKPESRCPRRGRTIFTTEGRKSPIYYIFPTPDGSDGAIYRGPQCEKEGRENPAREIEADRVNFPGEWGNDEKHG